MNDELAGLLGVNLPKAKEEAFTKGLLGAIFQAAALSGPQRSPVGTAQGLGQVGLTALGGYESAMDKTLEQAIKGLQVKDLLAKRAEEERLRKARADFEARLTGATTMQPTMQDVLATQSNIDPALLEGMSAQDVIGQAPKTRAVTDQAAANRAVMDYLRVASPEKYAELIAKEAKAPPGVVGEYLAAVENNLIPRGTSLQDYIALKKPPAPSATAIVGGGDLLPFEKKRDEAFAQEAQAWMAGGGQDVASQIAQLKPVITALEENKAITGVGVAVQPDLLLAFTNPLALQSREQVEEVVQRNLRAILGAQFTEKEGERLISRAFNAKLPPEQNAKRLRKLFLQMETAAEQKQAMVDYANRNGTLRGFQGKMPSVQDFISAMESVGGEESKKPAQKRSLKDIFGFNRGQ